MSEHQGRVVLVTGAGRGIGRSIALEFDQRGAQIALVARTREQLEETASLCVGDPLVIVEDLSDETACARAVLACTERFGVIDVLVNNAGYGTTSKFTEMTTDAWRGVMALNLDAPMWLTRSALTGMLARRTGRVIFVGSVASKVGIPYVAAYVAAKHAVLGLCRTLAVEYAVSGVTFNCVCPFYVDTPMTDRTIAEIVARTGRSDADTRSLLATPQGRLIDADEVAQACLYLSSAAARSMTGQALMIDGGRVQS